jgi:hypothetical protein
MPSSSAFCLARSQTMRVRGLLCSRDVDQLCERVWVGRVKLRDGIRWNRVGRTITGSAR